MGDRIRTLRTRVLQGLGLIVLAGLLGLGAAYMVLAPEVPESADLWSINRTRAITFLDSKGDVIGSRGGLHTDPVRLAELPPHLVNAFVTIEDKRFYDHSGVDWLGIARAMFINLREGRLVQGGSSITQQLAKNIFLKPDRTLSRKVQETILARQLEARLTKDEILELYLNRIYLGGGAFGVEAAAQTFFNKSARDVTLAEAAMLAGLPKAPTRWAPTANLEAAQERARVVLKALYGEKVISEWQYAEAYAKPATLGQQSVSGEVNYFLDHVTSQVNFIESALESFFDLDPQMDLIVTTTLDSTIQSKAEKALLSALEAQGEELNAEQAALVAIARDGAVRAMVGGKSYEQSQFNRAVQAKRQPGSAFKPFVYLTALTEGHQTDDLVYDEPVTIGDWSPSNYSPSYRGRMTLTEALQYSVNTVAVRISEEVGRDKIVEMANQVGIESNLTPNRSLPLGTEEVTLLELTSAYVPFVNGGQVSPNFVITKIEAKNGDVLWEYTPPDSKQVFTPEQARDMTYMMHQVILDGTGKRASLGARPAAGKTGTSQEWRDAWFMGYTGDLVAGVWVGNDDSTPMNRVTGGGLPAQIWKDFMGATHQGWSMSALPGAIPARTLAQNNDMKRYLSDLSNAMRKIAPPGTVVSSKAKKQKKKRKWWPF